MYIFNIYGESKMYISFLQTFILDVIYRLYKTNVATNIFICFCLPTINNI